MRALLTQKEQRQLRILEYLFENPDWIHLDPLAEDLDINTRIIKSDIKEMREVLSCFEIQSSTAGIRLANPKTWVLNEFTATFYKILLTSKF